MSMVLSRTLSLPYLVHSNFNVHPRCHQPESKLLGTRVLSVFRDTVSEAPPDFPRTQNMNNLFNSNDIGFSKLQIFNFRSLLTE